MSRGGQRFRGELVTLAHGAGGKATRALVEGVFLAELGNPVLAKLGDAAVVELEGATIAFTTDSYVVSPLFFPGGSIGDLAVNGTVNDLAVAGARPCYLTAGFVIEEGFAVADLRRIVAAMAQAADAASVTVVAGDTKVVERGKADGLYVTTAGVGALRAGVRLDAALVEPGDRVLVSGTIGDHGLAVMIARGGLELEADLASDTAPLNELAAALLEACPSVRWMRDPTRGGLATALNELASQSQCAVELDEAALPVRAAVAGVCEILGIDPLYAACEGRLVAVLGAEEAERGLATLRAHPLGRDAAEIGRVADEPAGFVLLETAFGGRRIVDVLVGDPLPRIC